MTLTATDVAAPLARYARRFHAAIGAGHHVASPLGAWLLLALCATASEAGALGATLGCVPAEAADLAAALLASPHPLVPAAAAPWIPPGKMTERGSPRLAGLPRGGARGVGVRPAAGRGAAVGGYRAACGRGRRRRAVHGGAACLVGAQQA